MRFAFHKWSSECFSWPAFVQGPIGLQLGELETVGCNIIDLLW